MGRGGHSRSGCIRCETCVGAPPGGRHPRGLEPVEGEHAQLGLCYGPPTAEHRQTRTDEMGEVYLPGTAVLPGRRFAHMRFYTTCPLAQIGEPRCPAPELRADWMDRVFEVAAWVSRNGRVEDIEPAPHPNLITAVRVVLEETALVDAERTKPPPGPAARRTTRR